MFEKKKFHEIDREVSREVPGLEGLIGTTSQSLKNHPYDLNNLIIRGTCYNNQEKFDLACRDFSLVLELGCNNDIYESILIQLESIVNLQLRQNPNNCVALMYRADLYRFKRDYNKALEDLDHILDQNPDDVLALTRRGQVYRLENRFEEALTDLDQVLDEEPNESFALIQRVLCQIENDMVADWNFDDLDTLLEEHPENPFALLVSAHAYFEGGFSLSMTTSEVQAKCLAMLDSVVARAPMTNLFSSALILRGQIYSLQGKLDLAINDLNLACMTLDKNNKSWVDLSWRNHHLSYRADVYRLRGEFELALNDLNKVLSIKPTETFALSRRGDIYRLEGKLDLALNDLNEILPIGSRDLEIEDIEAFALIRRGDIYRLQGKFDLALNDLNGALSNMTDNDSATDLQLKRNKVLALSCRGDVYRLQGKFDKALNDLNKALSKMEKNAPATDLELNRNKVLALSCRGDIYRLQGKFDLALNDLNEALKFEPNNSFVLSCRLEVYRVQGKWDLALLDLKRLLDMDLDASLNRLLEGDINACFCFINQSDQSAFKKRVNLLSEDLEQRLKVESNDILALSCLGFIYAYRSQSELAEQYLEKALKLGQGNNPFVLSCYANFHCCKKSFDSAEDMLNQALQLNPNNEEFLRSRSRIYCEQKLWGLAYEDLNNALNIMPNDPLLLRSRAIVYYHQGKLNEAKEDLDRVIQLNPCDALAWNYRGIIASDQGKLDKAGKYFSNALSLKPKNEFLLTSQATLYCFQQKLDLARNELDKVLVKDPHYLPALEVKNAIIAYDCFKNAKQNSDSLTDLCKNKIIINSLEIYHAMREKALPKIGNEFTELGLTKRTIFIFRKMIQGTTDVPDIFDLFENVQEDHSLAQPPVIDISGTFQSNVFFNNY